MDFRKKNEDILIHVRINEDIHEKLKDIAYDYNASIAHVVRKIIYSYFDEKNRKQI